MDSHYMDKHYNTPKDYGTTHYRVYFEVYEWQSIARNVITEVLLGRSSTSTAFHFEAEDLEEKPFGYEVDLPMQLIPEVVRELVEHKVGIYQIVRTPLKP